MKKSLSLLPGGLYQEQQLEQNNYDSEDGIIEFVHDILGVENIAPYQEKILRLFVRDRRVAVIAVHGAGKTALSAWAALWLITVFDVDTKVVTTASAWRQLEKYTWPEIRRWGRRARWDKMGIQLRPGKELLELQIKLGDKQAFAVASDDPSNIEGAHSTHLGYIFDEAKAIPPAIWDAAEGAFSTGGTGESRAYALAISTPGHPSGRLYDIFSGEPGYEDWTTVHVSLEEAIAAGRVSREWAEARKRQWGEDNSEYINRVLGKFASSSENNVVPLAWVEAAWERWRQCEGDGNRWNEEQWKQSDDPEKGEAPPALLSSYGVDPAYLGTDKTAICKLVGRVVEKIDSYAKQEPMLTVGRITAVADKKIPVAIDAIGIGAGVFSRLAELRYNVWGVDVRKKTKMRDKTRLRQFVNLRAAVWWIIREALDPEGDDPIALPPDKKLSNDLTTPIWGYRSDGRIYVESKDEMRKRLGRSPDMADALGLALYAARAAQKITMN